jgi:hypothetical protein
MTVKELGLDMRLVVVFRELIMLRSGTQVSVFAISTGRGLGLRGLMDLEAFAQLGLFAFLFQA